LQLASTAVTHTLAAVPPLPDIKKLGRFARVSASPQACRPQTNTKAERCVRTLLSEWPHARPYRRSRQRVAALDAYLDFYNFHRRHSALNHLPPASRLPAPV
jgi:transposase InsO family protein